MQTHSRAYRGKIYLDELQIACLWSAAEGMSWPAKESRLRTGSTFNRTGLPPSTFWRATLILLRTYGMRVQDLVAYERDKIPITWADICFDPRTPNPHAARSGRSVGCITNRGKSAESTICR